MIFKYGLLFLALIVRMSLFVKTYVCVRIRFDGYFGKFKYQFAEIGLNHISCFIHFWW